MKLKTTKTCNCCQANYTEVEDLIIKVWPDLGYMFNCGCGSTLVIKPDNVLHDELEYLEVIGL